jgi:hypothetical protein
VTGLDPVIGRHVAAQIAEVIGTSAEYRVSEVADRNAGIELKVNKDRLKSLAATEGVKWVAGVRHHLRDELNVQVTEGIIRPRLCGAEIGQGRVECGSNSPDALRVTVARGTGEPYAPEREYGPSEMHRRRESVGGRG